jgi:hypothetical protein
MDVITNPKELHELVMKSASYASLLGGEAQLEMFMVLSRSVSWMRAYMMQGHPAEEAKKLGESLDKMTREIEELSVEELKEKTEMWGKALEEAKPLVSALKKL